MSNYRVDRSIGYRPWGVTNPWVFADLSQPQRQRGSVSRGVFMTNPPKLVHPHLGQEADSAAQKQEERAARMEMIAIAGLAISATSLVLFLYGSGTLKKLMPNRRRRRRRRSRR